MSAAPVAMLPAEYHFPFLEKRQYLHGTTLFDAMVQHVPPGASVSFKISRRILSDKLRLDAWSDTDDRKDYQRATFGQNPGRSSQ